MPFLTVLAALSLQGCQDNDSDSQPTGHESVAVKLALSVAKSPSAGTTRMTSGNIKGEVANVQLRCVIPFAVDNDEITVSDPYQQTPIVGFGNFTQTKTITDGAFFTSACDFTPGVNKLLAYACDKRTSPVKGPVRGWLNESFESLQPNDIRFTLHPIRTRDTYLAYKSEGSSESDLPVAQALAAYLTAIAQAKTADNKTWKDDATDSKLKIMYKNFINELSAGVGDVLPGSAANVKKWADQLQSNLPASFTEGTTEQNTTDDAIKVAILAEIANWNPSWAGFPASVGLPDGAAVVRWQTVTENETTVEKFVPETQTTTIANINNIERFTYPAEIYYYGNSATMVSDVDLSGNFSGKSKWTKANESDKDAVLSGFTQGPVTSSTSTVAMKDPLQYAVAQLQVMLKATSTTLPDADDISVPVGLQTFKLTGIIVGGQLPVGFDFSPGSAMQGYSEAEMSFIYDNQVKTNGEGENGDFYLTTADAAYGINTLVLQSYNRQNVKLVLELENNSANDFKGLNGTVYRGTKFYLVGEIQPPNVDSNPQPYENRVFTKDYITIMNVTVKDLKKAYNVLPNLLSPRLEMGLELTPKWEQATTTDVIL